MKDAAHYAQYLIPAYGISAAVLLGLVAQTLLAARRWRRRAEAATDDPQAPS